MFDVRDVLGPDVNVRLRLPHEFPVQLASKRFAFPDWHNIVGSDCPRDIASQSVWRLRDCDCHCTTMLHRVHQLFPLRMSAPSRH
ncbi:hypothetical protein, partial [Gluconobacter sphaericus]|uniref:hypothetical protein n=1 Tax=Gluconobacter sphaericus TaxID=574987 RepID=UPI001C3FBEB6